MLDRQKLIEAIYSTDNQERIAGDRERYMVFNGRVRESIRKAIEKEFLLPDTIRELVNRVIPINITQKIVKKLATVYKEEPRREDAHGNAGDTELLEKYEDWLSINHVMMGANQLFKLTKNCLQEIFAHKGTPRVRSLASHTYTPYNDDPIDPVTPTAFIKHISFGSVDKADDQHVVWSDTEHFTMNGRGEIIPNPDNPDNINPYGVMPFVYINESDDSLSPISDDDLLRMQIVICLLLTDLAFASKYQAWSIIALINATTEKMSFNPNSVITLESRNGADPDIKVIKPELDSDALLRLVESLLGMLLTTKNLSVGSVTGEVTAQQAASGVAKVLDSAESTEDKEIQTLYFKRAEKELWTKLAHFMIPVWLDNGMLEPEFAGRFSDEFQLSINFPDQRPAITEKDRLDIEVTKLKNNLTTHFLAVQEINPEYTSDEVTQVLDEIKKEKMDIFEAMMPQVGVSPDGENAQV